jgi:hypothetical protein
MGLVFLKFAGDKLETGGRQRSPIRRKRDSGAWWADYRVLVYDNSSLPTICLQFSAAALAITGISGFKTHQNRCFWKML